MEYNLSPIRNSIVAPVICIGLFLAFDAYHRAYGALLLEYKMLARVPPAVQGIVVLVAARQRS